MKDKQLHHLKNKMKDFKQFSFIFLFIGAFLNIGSFLPFDGKTIVRTEILQIASFVLIFISLVFYWSLNKAKKQYEENL